MHCSALSSPPSPFFHKSLQRLSEDQSSCSSQINKMNFKFLLAGNMAGFFFIKSQLMLLHFSVCGCCGPDAHCPLPQRQVEAQGTAQGTARNKKYWYSNLKSTFFNMNTVVTSLIHMKITLHTSITRLPGWMVCIQWEMLQVLF